MTTPIAIPSAYRAGRARSMEQLARLEGGPHPVIWYVPTAQAPEYRRALPGWMHVEPITDCETVNVARNAIVDDHYGSDVAIMEDDVPWFHGSNSVFDPALRPPSAPRTPRMYVDEVVRLGTRLMDGAGLHMWGIYPVSYSGAALKGRIGIGSLFCVGQLMGLRLTDDWRPALDLPIKEDYEMSARAVERWGELGRLDLVAAYSVSGHGEGGTNVYRNPSLESWAVDRLLERWPNLFADTGKERDGLRQVKMLTPNGPTRWIQVAPEPGYNYAR